MFDNPKEELKRLEQQLLAVEEKDADFEAFYDDILREFGPENAAPARKASTQKKAPQKNTYTDHARKPAPVKKQKGVGGLAVTLCLECIGIAGIVLWWILRIL